MAIKKAFDVYGVEVAPYSAKISPRFEVEVVFTSDKTSEGCVGIYKHSLWDINRRSQLKVSIVRDAVDLVLAKLVKHGHTNIELTRVGVTATSTVLWNPPKKEENHA